MVTSIEPLHTLLRPATRAIGAALSGDVKATRAALGQYYGFVKSSNEAARAAIESYKSRGPILDADIRSAAVEGSYNPLNDFSPKGRIGKGVVKAAKAVDATAISQPFRILGMSDEYFKQINHRSFVRANALQNAWEKGLKGADAEAWAEKAVQGSVDELGRAIDDVGLQEARKATFTGNLESHTGKFLQQIPSIPVLNVLVPFVRTPANLLKEGFAHTPIVNVIAPALRKDFTAGGTRQHDAIGRVAVGLGMGTLGITAAMEGKLTGSGPADWKLRKQLERTGWKPFSFVTEDAEGNRTYIQYNKLDPIGFVLGLMADMPTLMTSLSEREGMDIVNTLIATTASYTYDKAMFKGLTQAVEAIQSNDPDKVGRYFKNLTVSHIPNALTQANDLVGDDRLKEARTLGEMARRKAGFYDDDLAIRRGPTGLPDYKSSRWVFPLLPLTNQQERDDIVFKEFANLGEEEGTYFDNPQETLGNLDLTEFVGAESGMTAYDRYMEILGTEPIFGDMTLHEQLADIISTDAYQELPFGTKDFPSARKKLLQRSMEKGRLIALNRMLQEPEFEDLYDSHLQDRIDSSTVAGGGILQ